MYLIVLLVLEQAMNTEGIWARKELMKNLKIKEKYSQQAVPLYHACSKSIETKTVFTIYRNQKFVNALQNNTVSKWSNYTRKLFLGRSTFKTHILSDGKIIRDVLANVLDGELWNPVVSWKFLSLMAYLPSRVI